MPEARSSPPPTSRARRSRRLSLPSSRLLRAAGWWRQPPTRSPWPPPDRASSPRSSPGPPMNGDRDMTTKRFFMAVKGLPSPSGGGGASLRVIARGDPVPLPIKPSPSPRPWDSFLAWMLGGSLTVILPCLALAAFFNLAERGLWWEIGWALMLIALLALATWLIARPVLDLSRASAGIESGDLSSRAVPGGGGETRRLALTFNAVLDRFVKDLPRLRGAASESAKRLSVSAEQLASATAE